MEGRRPGGRRESRQVWRLHALRARARRVLRETEAARRRAGRRARSVLQGPRGQPSAHPRLDGVRRGVDAAAGRSHRLALPDRARPAPALGGHPDPGGSADPHGQRRPESAELRRDDAHGALRRPARRGRADVRSRRRGQGSRGDGRTRFLRQAGPARAVGGMVMGERELTYGEAVKEAIAEEMRRDPRVFLIGEDVAEAGHPFKTLTGLVQEFGTQRIIDTPISEPGYAGIGVGAAMTGMRPVVDVMFGDFITLTMDQMVNQAAKAHYMSGGKIKVPIVFRTTLGATRRSAAQ